MSAGQNTSKCMCVVTVMMYKKKWCSKWDCSIFWITVPWNFCGEWSTLHHNMTMPYLFSIHCPHIILPVTTTVDILPFPSASYSHNLCWRHNYWNADQLTQKPVIAIWCMLSFTHFSTISIQSRPSCSSLQHFLSSLYRSKSCNQYTVKNHSYITHLNRVFLHCQTPFTTNFINLSTYC